MQVAIYRCSLSYSFNFSLCLNILNKSWEVWKNTVIKKKKKKVIKWSVVNHQKIVRGDSMAGVTNVDFKPVSYDTYTAWTLAK